MVRIQQGDLSIPVNFCGWLVASVDSKLIVEEGLYKSCVICFVIRFMYDDF